MPEDYKNLADNLRVLCGFGKSVADISRRTGINRQQLVGYISGSARPGLNTLRRLCDFFGVDEFELFLSPAEFNGLIKRRPPSMSGRSNLFMQNVAEITRTDAAGTSSLKALVGYYFIYYQPIRNEPRILRNIVSLCWTEHGLITRERSYCRMPTGVKRRATYQGVGYVNGDTVFVLDREAHDAESQWVMMMKLPKKLPQKYLYGLAMGTSAFLGHQIGSYRVVWEFLGQKIALRTRIKQCGLIALPTTELPETVVACILNDLSPDEQRFQVRFALY